MEEMLKEIIVTIVDTKTLVILSTGFIVGDIITGYIKAFKNKKYNSSVNRDGLARKMMWYMMIILGCFIEWIAHTNAISILVCTTCCITEFMSVIENARDVGIEFKITQYLADKESDDDGK